MFKKLFSHFKKEGGFTLIELLVSIAIIGLLGVAVNMGITQTVRLGAHGSEYVTAIKQVENALQWLNKDVQQAQRITLTMGTGFPISIYWTEWDGTTNEITYQISGDELQRVHTINSSDTRQIVVARYVETDSQLTNCRFTDNGSFWLVDIGDSFTIYGGVAADDGLLVATQGSISVTTTGTATYNSSAWTAPATGDNVIVTATSTNARGVWTATNLNALVSMTTDTDHDATLSGSAIIITITAAGGTDSTQTETRIALIFPRSRA